MSLPVPPCPPLLPDNGQKSISRSTRRQFGSCREGAVSAGKVWSAALDSNERVGAKTSPPPHLKSRPTNERTSPRTHGDPGQFMAATGASRRPAGCLERTEVRKCGACKQDNEDFILSRVGPATESEEKISVPGGKSYRTL